MKKINITVVCAGEECYPGCIDLLSAYPEIRIVAQPTGLNEPGTWDALGCSDVLLLDEAVLDQDGHHAIRAIHDSYPLLGSLLILENDSQQETMTVLSLGILGIIRRESTTSQLCKAVTAICAGEAWLPRKMVQPLHRQLGQEKGGPGRLEDLPAPSGRMKLH
jgi:DNA-binding NarL/FixJ family response regulator